jgi:hypothetical protein
LKLMYGCFLLNKFKSLEALHSLNQLTLLFEHICTWRLDFFDWNVLTWSMPRQLFIQNIVKTYLEIMVLSLPSSLLGRTTSDLQGHLFQIILLQLKRDNPHCQLYNIKSGRGLNGFDNGVLLNPLSHS